MNYYVNIYPLVNDINYISGAKLKLFNTTE